MLTSEFSRELEESLYLHRPLPIHAERSVEAGFAAKHVTASRVLWGSEKIAEPLCPKQGTMHVAGDIITITAPQRCTQWPAGSTGFYEGYGQINLLFSFPAQSWEAYNRIRFFVKPEISGARIIPVCVCITNEGKIPVPDKYYREGASVRDVDNHVWNEIIWEFPTLPRDAVTSLQLYIYLAGNDAASAETAQYSFRDISLEHVQHEEHEHGWQSKGSWLHASSAGYYAKGEKTAIASADCDSFSLFCETENTCVFTSKTKPVQNANGSFAVLDFSSVSQQGMYYLQTSNLRSDSFPISDTLEEESLWRAINFLFCERCGSPVAGKHSACHHDVLAEHDGVKISFAGGWHDAGDVSQQAVQTAEIVHALFENAQKQKRNRFLYLRLMEEAQWGLDFILRTRFGDGYRATSAVLTRITDGFLGNFDDVEAYVHNHSYENFMFAAVEAYAALCLKTEDAALSDGCLRAALADFSFALAVFAQTGVDPFHPYEHTYNSGLSQYYAVIVWAASALYQACGDAQYAAYAREYAAKLLACQEQGKKAPIAGFFYRDETHNTIVHFNHQSREGQFMQALVLLCQTQPTAAELPQWQQGIALYGAYLKAIAGNTAPYGMLPAGVHHVSEAEDADTFRWLHVQATHDAEAANYRAQLAAGTPIGNGYVLRNFPVWFSFRGNSAVMLSMGKAAALAGNYLQDKTLLQIAREQVYWHFGKNPFGQSLVFGAGNRYPRMYAALCGEAAGEMPVGVQTLDNEDVPYWPQNTNCTYKEIWVSTVCRWLWLLSELS